MSIKRTSRRSRGLPTCGDSGKSDRPAGYATRREFITKSGAGFGAVALAGLLSKANGSDNPLSEKKPHFVPTAKRVIFLFMEGGPSHLDLFDRKPLLQEMAGKTIPDSMPALPSFFRLKKSVQGISPRGNTKLFESWTT